VTIRTQKRHVERFAVIPVMALKALAASTPGAPHRPLDQAERFAEGRRATRRAGSNAPGLEHVPTNLQMTTETSEQGPLTLASDLFHLSQPVSWIRRPPRSQREGEKGASSEQPPIGRDAPPTAEKNGSFSKPFNYNARSTQAADSPQNND